MYAYEIEGRKAKAKWWKVLVVITVILLGSAVIIIARNSHIFSGSSGATNEDVTSKISRVWTGTGSSRLFYGTSCRNIGGLKNCDLSTEKAKQEASQVKVWYAQSDTIMASVTEYTAQESCSFKTKEGCLTASGTIATPGRTAACPKRFTFGTKIIINGHEYICEDRTADFIQVKYGDTFDLFAADYQKALRFGRKTVNVLYEKN